MAIRIDSPFSKIVDFVHGAVVDNAIALYHFLPDVTRYVLGVDHTLGEGRQLPPREIVSGLWRSYDDWGSEGANPITGPIYRSIDVVNGMVYGGLDLLSGHSLNAAFNDELGFHIPYFTPAPQDPRGMGRDLGMAAIIFSTPAIKAEISRAAGIEPEPTPVIVERPKQTPVAQPRLAPAGGWGVFMVVPGFERLAQLVTDRVLRMRDNWLNPERAIEARSPRRDGLIHVDPAALLAVRGRLPFWMSSFAMHFHDILGNHNHLVGALRSALERLERDGGADAAFAGEQGMDPEPDLPNGAYMRYLMGAVKLSGIAAERDAVLQEAQSRPTLQIYFQILAAIAAQGDLEAGESLVSMAREGNEHARVVLRNLNMGALEMFMRKQQRDVTRMNAIVTYAGELGNPTADEVLAHPRPAPDPD